MRRTVATHCFAERSTGGWIAHCVELGLSVRGPTLDTVRAALDDLVRRALEDAKPSPTRAFIASPTATQRMRLMIRFWWLRLAGTLGLRSDAFARPGPRSKVRRTLAPAR